MKKITELSRIASDFFFTALIIGQYILYGTESKEIKNTPTNRQLFEILMGLFKFNFADKIIFYAINQAIEHGKIIDASFLGKISAELAKDKSIDTINSSYFCDYLEALDTKDIKIFIDANKGLINEKYPFFSNENIKDIKLNEYFLFKSPAASGFMPAVLISDYNNISTIRTLTAGFEAFAMHNYIKGSEIKKASFKDIEQAFGAPLMTEFKKGIDSMLEKTAENQQKFFKKYETKEAKKLENEGKAEKMQEAYKSKLELIQAAKNNIDLSKAFDKARSKATFGSISKAMMLKLSAAKKALENKFTLQEKAAKKAEETKTDLSNAKKADKEALKNDASQTNRATTEATKATKTANKPLSKAQKMKIAKAKKDLLASNKAAKEAKELKKELDKKEADKIKA